MAILAISRDWGSDPSLVRINASTSTLTQVGTSGYLTAQASNIAALNAGPFEWQASDMVLVYASDGWGFFTLSSDETSLNAFSLSPSVIGATVIGDFAVFASVDGNLEDLGYLPSDASKTRVVMAGGAVVANHIALFQDVTGTIDDVAATALNNGPIQAGASGTSGYLASFPPTAARGSLRLTAINNAGDSLVTISNASHGQASVYSIPDGGQATGEFIISDSAGTQHITSGSFQIDDGNMTIGSSGNVGSLTLFPATAANGTLVLLPINAGADFDTTISNAASVGQDQVLTIPDAGQATGNFAVAPNALVNANLIEASGTGGLVVDSGIATSDVQLNTNIVAATTADIGGGGAGPISVVVAGLTAASVVVATIESSTNVAAVAKCTATATGFDITFTADPGAACLVNFVAFIAAQ